MELDVTTSALLIPVDPYSRTLAVTKICEPLVQPSRVSTVFKILIGGNTGLTARLNIKRAWSLIDLVQGRLRMAQVEIIHASRTSLSASCRRSCRE
jgi:hypothetical protein